MMEVVLYEIRGGVVDARPAGLPVRVLYPTLICPIPLVLGALKLSREGSNGWLLNDGRQAVRFNTYEEAERWFRLLTTQLEDQDEYTS